MATPDDVNAQHLAAMGLAEQPLGQPVKETSDQRRANEGRCESWGLPGRCAGYERHLGTHFRGKVRWTDSEAVEPESLTEVFTLSCDDAKANVEHAAHIYQIGEVQHTCPGHRTLQRLAPSTLDSIIALARPTKQRPGDQALPQGGKECVQDLIIADMEESKRVGRERYGSVLMTFNGRKGFQDVHEEVRDLLVYLTAMRREAEATRETLIEVVTQALTDYPEQSRVEMAPENAATRAVDTVMGWVVGQMNTTTAEEQEHA